MLAARAYLPEGRLGAGLSKVQGEVARILAVFEAAQATLVEPGSLLPADVLLDLYGEDIRARAYTTHDPVEGELMLRPDFTVPVTQMHAAHGATPARYTYAGPVWRKQEPGAGRPTEYLQVGFELFDGSDAAAADAEVFALITDVLVEQGLSVETGDLGVLATAVDALSLDERRKAMLRHHIWRPAKFKRLLERFSKPTPPNADRAALLAMSGEKLKAHLQTLSPDNGVRSMDDIAVRIAELAEEQTLAPLPKAEVDLLNAVLNLRGTMVEGLRALRGLALQMPALTVAADRIEQRMSALSARGIDAENLSFAVSFGRTTLEYYDGFVFGFVDPARPDLPPIATGGRYDALTAALGPSIPAVGGIIRPEALLARGEMT